jgi:hypothetical protein
MIKKTLCAVGITFLFIAVALPISALTTTTENIEEQEAAAIEQFMNEVERSAGDSKSYTEFLQKLKDLCLNNNCDRFPIIRSLLHKIICYLMSQTGLYIRGINVYDLIEKISPNQRPDYFVISYGTYDRLNPIKENSVERFKKGLSLWRYSDSSMLVNGRTLILERQPFGIHQRMTGPQLGLMKGFRGIYLDIESKLTGSSYVFFMGRVDRIRAFDLTPLSD